MNIEEIVEKVQRRVGEGAVRMVRDGALSFPRLSTQSIVLDRALGGGVPLGTVVELYGDVGCGKTTLSLHLLAEAQKRRGLSVYFDTENALDLSYASRILDVDELIYSQPDSGEGIFDVLNTLLDEKYETNSMRSVPGIFVVDSVAGIVTEAEIEAISKPGGYRKSSQKYSPVARLLSSSLKTVTKKLRELNSTLLFVNQIRVRIDPFVGGIDTPGGKALKFYSSVRMEVKLRGTFGDEEKEGQIVKVSVVKNKTFFPFQEAEIRILWGKGIDVGYDIVQASVQAGLLKRKGNWYVFGKRKFNGLKRLLSDENALKELRKELGG